MRAETSIQNGNEPEVSAAQPLRDLCLEEGTVMSFELGCGGTPSMVRFNKRGKSDYSNRWDAAAIGPQ